MANDKTLGAPIDAALEPFDTVTRLVVTATAAVADAARVAASFMPKNADADVVEVVNGMTSLMKKIDKEHNAVETAIQDWTTTVGGSLADLTPSDALSFANEAGAFDWTGPVIGQGLSYVTDNIGMFTEMLTSGGQGVGGAWPPLSFGEHLLNLTGGSAVTGYIISSIPDVISKFADILGDGEVKKMLQSIANGLESMEAASMAVPFIGAVISSITMALDMDAQMRDIASKDGSRWAAARWQTYTSLTTARPIGRGKDSSPTYYENVYNAPSQMRLEGQAILQSTVGCVLRILVEMDVICQYFNVPPEAGKFGARAFSSKTYVGIDGQQHFHRYAVGNRTGDILDSLLNDYSDETLTVRSDYARAWFSARNQYLANPIITQIDGGRELVRYLLTILNVMKKSKRLSFREVVLACHSVSVGQAGHHYNPSDDAQTIIGSYGPTDLAAAALSAGTELARKIWSVI